jgi:hypothetical protein
MTLPWVHWALWEASSSSHHQPISYPQATTNGPYQNPVSTHALKFGVRYQSCAKFVYLCAQLPSFTTLSHPYKSPSLFTVLSSSSFKLQFSHYKKCDLLCHFYLWQCKICHKITMFMMNFMRTFWSMMKKCSSLNFLRKHHKLTHYKIMIFFYNNT